VLVLAGLLFMSVGAFVALSSASFDFDTDEDRLMRRRFGNRKVRPLSDVLAIQVLCGQAKNQAAAWEFNLVLNDEGEPRWNLARHSMEPVIWRQASELADFLKVPLLDHRQWAEKIKVDGQELEVPLTPLEGKGANFKTTILVQPRPDCLEVQPSFCAKLFCVIWVGFCLVGAVVMVTIAVKVGLLLLLFAIPFELAFAGVGIWLWRNQCRYEFDAATGLLTCQRGRVRRELPLSSIRAVQVLYVYHDGSENSYAGWQLNLVLKNSEEPRLNLSDHTNKKSTLDDARRLSEFLGVPFLDHSAAKEK
jgi:hypothetical protein